MSAPAPRRSDLEALTERLREFGVMPFEPSPELMEWLRDNAELRRDAANALTALAAEVERMRKVLREIATRDSHTRFDGYGRPSKVPGPYAFIAPEGKDNE